MSKNYTVYHLHSTASNLSGAGMDSVTNYKDYIKKAKEYGMTSLCFSEHGNFFLYKKKKDAIEQNGMKYIHGIEAYVTENIEEQVRDNYHIILIARNYDGFKELNKLQSKAFERDGHYYYAPRILLDDILNTSKNIIVTSACFTKGNKVLTKNGYKNIEDITNKDFVKNMYGEWEQVNYPTRINYIGKGKEIGICGEIQKIRCTNDHKFLTITANSKIPKWKKAEELTDKPGSTKPILLFPVKTEYNNREYIYREEWEGSYIVTKKRKKIILPDKIKITPEFMRFIGMFTADGCISLGVNPRLSVTINISEFETYYNSFIKELENQLGIKFSIRKSPDRNRADLLFCGNDFINLFYWLFKNQKAINKRFPEQLMHISKEMDEELLFGYIISDGYVRESISKKIKNCATTGITCASISIGLIDDIKNILSSLHIKYGLSKSEEKIDKNNVHHCESYYLYLSDKNFKDDIKKIDYSHHKVCQMFDSVIESKKNKFVLIDGTIYEKKFVKSISEISLNEEVYCLNNNSHSFVCGNVIVHNCIGGLLGKGNEAVKEKFLNFMSENNDRCFLEIQHHNVQKQKEYNKKMVEWHYQYNIPLIAGTDTHCLNSDHEKARKIMQLSKKIIFNDDEDGWDLIFRSYDELVDAYKVQGVLPEDVFLEAIENTNVLAEMVEPINFDLSFKYPKLYENSKDKLYKMIFDESSINSIVNEGFSKEEVLERLKEEYETFVAVDAVDYILLIKYIIDWAHNKDMWQGPARGSAASSLALYELGITEVNPLKYGFKFWRFMHKDKYSAADVDTDWAEKDRDRLKEWMLLEKMNLPKIQTAEIITFNTIALKGAIRDVGRGLNMPLEEVDVIAKAVKEVTEDENKYVTIDDSWRKKYPELFRYVDLVQGVFTSVGSHPSGVLVTDEEISEEIGYCYIKGDDYPVSVLDMVELDSRNFVKEDLLGLDNVGIINETCKIANIDRVSPKTINYEDDLVWNQIMQDTSLLFQINSDYGKRTVNKMFDKNIWNKIKRNVPNITRFDLLAFICALVRPCGKNVYPIVTEGNSRRTGIKEMDELLGPEMGYPILQETQMEFVQKFCGFSFLESDKLRKCVAKGSLVTMADGSLKPIEDVEVGEQVISYEDGIFTPKKVVGNYDNGIKEIVDVKFQNGFNLKCTKDHKVLTQDGWKEVQFLTENDYVYTPTKIICNDDGLRSNQKYSILQYWLLGALIGDGCLGSDFNFSFVNSEKCLISAVQKGIREFDSSSEITISSIEGKTVNHIYRLGVKGYSHSTIRNHIVALGLNHCASEKQIPKQIICLNPTEKLASFVGGLFNTDGGYDYTRNTIGYSSISKNLILGIRNILLKFGIFSKISTKKVSNYNYNSYVLYIDGKDNLKIFKRKILPYIIGRKHEEFLTIINRENSYREYLPNKCKKELDKYLLDRKQTQNRFFLECFGEKPPRTSNNYGVKKDFVKKWNEVCYLPYSYFVCNSDIRPVKFVSMEFSGKCRVYDLEVEETHNYIVSGVVAHNCVAKKKGTREQLPLIKEGFEKNAKVKYNLTQEESDDIINPFLQCILDATRYAFGRAHDYSYTAISYESAWLRTYYPLEYLTCCFNSYVDKQEKINEVTEYCVRNKIKIQNPKFRYSKSDYFFDKEQRTIYKGTRSIKFLNAAVSDALYSLRDNKYGNFVEALQDIFKTGIDSRQLNILIKLDYFSEFGNSRELLKIVDMCSMFKNGEAKSVSKTKIENDNILYRIVARHSNETPKKFTINNCWEILKDCEFYIKSVDIKDFTFKEKANFQMEYMGYVDLKTNNEKDRPNIFVLSMRKLKAKNSSEPWAVQIDGQSIGSGIRNSYTIFYRDYKKEPFENNDIIRIKKFHKNVRGYWNVDSYERIFGI